MKLDNDPRWKKLARQHEEIQRMELKCMEEMTAIIKEYANKEG